MCAPTEKSLPKIDEINKSQCYKSWRCNFERLLKVDTEFGRSPQVVEFIQLL